MSCSGRSCRRSRIAQEIVYPHPPAAVRRGLTDRAALASWLMPSDFAPEVGHRFPLTARPAPGFDGVVRCTPRGRLAATAVGLLSRRPGRG